MISLGLSPVERRAFEACLAETHRIRVAVRVHDRNERVIGELPTELLLSGAVHVDTSQDPARTLDVTILEPRAVGWLPDSPGDADVFANNFLSVRYGVDVPGLGWVDVPVFWGPVVGVDDEGEQVTLRAAGKEVLALAPAVLWKTYTVHKGVKRTTAVRRLLEEQGEQRFDLPEIGAKLGKTLSLARDAQPWRVAGSIVGGMGRQLFYDGRGRVRVRKYPGNRVFSFHGGDGGTVLTRPRLSYSLEEVRNTVEVLGPEPAGPPTRIRAVARPNASHNLSAEQLARHGAPRWLVETIDADLEKPELEHHARTKKRDAFWGVPSGVKNPRRWRRRRHGVIVNRQRQAEQIAERELDDLLTATVEVDFTTLPVPHLEEGDRVAVHVDGQHLEFRVRAFTLPLVSSEPQSIGTTRRVSWRRRATGGRRGARRR